jgi:hypothetical protein
MRHEKREAVSALASSTVMIVASKDGFALLTAAPGGRWSHADELRTGFLRGRFITHGPHPCLHPSPRKQYRAALRQME